MTKDPAQMEAALDEAEALIASLRSRTVALNLTLRKREGEISSLRADVDRLASQAGIDDEASSTD